MLTQETKRKIDSARDILVGKVPDPKAQVEQITTALIYKFMDDMDKGSQELGGKTRFFTGGFEKYSWTKLMDPKLGGHDRMDLYVETLTKLSLNPNIPQLFRDIFKDAFLPYRNPETLSLFLKEINGFTYEHSEDLGDSFEYLLSVLGSQGDAGQFRTPRHIIDFIVAAIDPKKDDTVCDPACGTAGFLISAYKHILKQHDGKDDPENKEKPLTPDERKNLMDHFTGYDISPDMVRLSRVNLYLHGFPSPTIYEYDTLSSEEKWDESFDVMLANPPFMTPKGGIKSHKRFSVQANRSEVLFVDYILEHLRPNGRAGIIVPEGIIFKSETAYKKLRKMLVEDGLIAVVSLPSGVFNPYSGVKTGILLFDKALAKKTQNILFIKIENDGYGLGAQRRPIDKNDLPVALEIVKKYKVALKDDKLFELNDDEKKFAHVVAKEKIAETGDYNLSGDRYKEVAERTNQKWPIVALGEVCIFEYGKPLKGEDREHGEYPVYGSNGVVGYHNKYLVEGPFIIVGRKGTAGAVVYSEKSGFPIDTTFYIRLLDKEKIVLKYLFFVLRTLGLDKINTQAGIPGLNRNDAYKIKIPLPPLEVQKEIVEQIEVKQQAIEHAKAIIKNLERERAYFGQSLRKLDGVEYLTIGDLCEIKGGKRIPKDRDFVSFRTDYPYIRVSDFKNGTIDLANLKYIDKDIFEIIKRYTISKNDVYISIAGTIGLVGVVPNVLDGKSLTENAAKLIVKDHKKLFYKYLAWILQNDENQKQIANLKKGVGVPKLSLERIATIKIPLPSLKVQKQLVEEAEGEEEIVAANRRLIEIMEQKIANVLDEI